MTMLRTGEETPVEIRNDTPPRSTFTESYETPYMPPAVEYRGPRDVIFNPAAMERDKPYPYELDGAHFVVIRRATGQLDFYELPVR